MNSRANCSRRWLGTTYIGFLMRPACFIFMPVAAIVNVLPAATAWASSVLPLLMPRQTASAWCDRRLRVRLMLGKSRWEPEQLGGKGLDVALGNPRSPEIGVDVAG